MKIEITPTEFVGFGWLTILAVILSADLPFPTGLFLLLFWFYLGAHIFFGPLDWYLLYKLYLKLRR